MYMHEELNRWLRNLTYEKDAVIRDDPRTPHAIFHAMSNRLVLPLLLNKKDKVRNRRMCAAISPSCWAVPYDKFFKKVFDEIQRLDPHRIYYGVLRREIQTIHHTDYYYLAAKYHRDDAALAYAASLARHRSTDDFIMAESRPTTYRGLAKVKHPAQSVKRLAEEWLKERSFHLNSTYFTTVTGAVSAKNLTAFSQHLYRGDRNNQNYALYAYGNPGLDTFGGLVPVIACVGSKCCAHLVLVNYESYAALTKPAQGEVQKIIQVAREKGYLTATVCAEVSRKRSTAGWASGTALEAYVDYYQDPNNYPWWGETFPYQMTEDDYRAIKLTLFQPPDNLVEAYKEASLEEKETIMNFASV